MPGCRVLKRLLQRFAIQRLGLVGRPGAQSALERDAYASAFSPSPRVIMLRARGSGGAAISSGSRTPPSYQARPLTLVYSEHESTVWISSIKPRAR
jgi:hypothetical protein